MQTRNDLGMGYLIIVNSKMHNTFGINNMINWKDKYTSIMTRPLFFRFCVNFTVLIYIN